MKTGALASLGVASLSAFGVDSVQAKAVRENLNQPMLVVHDLWPEVQPLLDASARMAVEEKAHMNTVVEINGNGEFPKDIEIYTVPNREAYNKFWASGRHTMRIHYFGAKVDSLQDGVGVLADIINDLTKRYEIRGHLLKAGAIELVGDEFAVITYLAVHYNDSERVEKEKFWCQEGQAGPYVGKRSEEERERRLRNLEEWRDKYKKRPKSG
jgi:hypothetical protein